MAQSLIGASPFEQQLYDHFVSHVEAEVGSLQAYERLAESTQSEAFRYLARLILDDERRHHRMLQDLADSIRSSTEMDTREPDVPYLDLYKDREAILEATKTLMAVEDADDKELKALAKQVRDFKDTTLWDLIIEILKADNAKHRLILKFIQDHARRI